MKVLPELNLNKHPRDVTNGSLCYAENIMVSKDNSVIQSEPILKNSELHIKLIEILQRENYNIIFAIPCNKEIIFFIQNETNEEILNVYRYNEELNDIDDTKCIVEYHGGKFVGTFTYNKNRLIIIFSEYDVENCNIPLRTIELGKFKEENLKDNEITDVTLQPIVSKVIIPYSYCEDITGSSAYKGFYYFFVRFKINNNVYTQWYNTNTSFLLDESSENIYFDIKGKIEDRENSKYNSFAKAYYSSNEDFCSKTIKFNFGFFDGFKDEVVNDGVPYYEYLQIGYIIIKKGFSKAYRSIDIKFNYDSDDYYKYIINPKHDIEISMSEMITTYNNYYNIKTLVNNNNKLYIGNYIEEYENINLDNENINIELYAIQHIDDNFPEFGENPEIDNSEDNEINPDKDTIVDHYKIRLTTIDRSGEEFNLGEVNAYIDDNGEYYYTLSDCFIFKFTKDNNIIYHGGINDHFTHSFPIGVTTNCIIEHRQFNSNDFTKTIIREDGTSSKIMLHINDDKVKGIINKTYIFEPHFGYIDIDSPNNYRIYPFRFSSFEYNKIQCYPYDNILCKTTNTQGGLKIKYSNNEVIEKSIGFLTNTINKAYVPLFDKNASRPSGDVHYISCFIEDPVSYTKDNPVYCGLLCGEYSGNATTKNKFIVIAYNKNNEEISKIEITNNNSNKAPILDNKKRLNGYEHTPGGKEIIIGNKNKDNSFNMPYNAYNFFIHFINKYGIPTNGYNLSNFNIKNINSNTSPYYFENNIGNRIINIDYHKTIKLKLDKLPTNYIGYFVSYEKPEFKCVYQCFYRVKYNNAPTNEIYCYTGEFDLYDKINWDFNQVSIVNEVSFNDEFNDTSGDKSLNYTTNKVLGASPYNNIRNITSKVLLVADASDNIGQGSAIKIIVDGNPFTKETKGILYLIKKYDIGINNFKKRYTINAYNNENKTLIPCSPIQYSKGFVFINTKTAFKTNCYYLDYRKDIIFNNVINQFNLEYSKQEITDILHHNRWELYRPNQLDYKNINNSPEIVIVPIDGLNTEDPKEKSFARSKIVQVPNSIDLFEYKHYTYYEGYPKVLDWHNPNLDYNNIFPKTIRRSNIIQDESNNNAWRQFPIEQYKTITENKGEIIKLISIGNIFLIHTKHSLFQFTNDNSIKTSNDSINDKIQLAPIDIWDTNYKEVISSILGKAGINKEYHGIIGEYGYIWYDKDENHIYRYDNNKLGIIDDKIINFISKLENYDINIIEDTIRNRLLFNFVGNNNFIISYNYNLNTFVSFHSYNIIKGYNTKTQLYLIDNNIIKDFDNNIYNNCSLNIIVNSNFTLMKKIEYITYNIRCILQKMFNIQSPVEELDDYYAGDFIRIYNNIFDTGYIDISSKTDNTINQNFNKDYTKPYWKFGNWHFNYIWNKIKENDNIIGKSMNFGNYFVVEFKFNIDKQIEIEDINVEYSNAELI